MKPQRRVALLISTTGASERDVLKGIGVYARGAREWVCQFQQPSSENIRRLAAYKPDGVIAAVWQREWIEPLREMRVPIVNVADVLHDVPFRSITHDSATIAEMAVAYFAGLGFKHLAYVGLINEHFSDLRAQAFAHSAATHGRTCRILRLEQPGHRPGYGWREQDEDLIRWVEQLDRPTGILASNDGRAIQLIEASKQLGLRTPDDIAVVGIDNDDLLCSLARPPLSSIQLASEKLGFEAARTLDAMMNRRRPPRVAPLPPVGVITRQSSDVLAISDADLACAIKYIRDNAHRPIRADEVSRQVAIARRSLERRFVAHLGHTILDEIHAAHTDLAKQLLANTDLGMPEVAERSGFASIRHLPLIFRRLTGMTPSQYRRNHRLRQ